jgi:indole-3-glycerol phosphate synthase
MSDGTMVDATLFDGEGKCHWPSVAQKGKLRVMMALGILMRITSSDVISSASLMPHPPAPSKHKNHLFRCATMRVSSVLSTAILSLVAHCPHAFIPVAPQNALKQSKFSSATSLWAIGVLARKAKEADVRKYCEAGVSDDVMEQYNRIKSKSDDIDLSHASPGPLQQVLTRRKGTITLIAEYKRKIEGAGYIDDVFDPEILSPTFREFGASGIAVMADERMGGCNYTDLQDFITEQARAANKVPGPVLVINNDLIVDEIQIARSAAMKCQGVVLVFDILGEEKVVEFLKAARAVDIEAIVAISTHEQAQTAIDVGARIIKVVNVEGADNKAAVIQGLEVPEGQQVCTIANILARDNKQMEEIEEAWISRDKGFNCVWVSDALYKGGADPSEHPGAIIKSMTAKSSVKWASPKARSGKGEGAREYLGDILM